MAPVTARDVFDCSGVAVITGAASGFGWEVAQRCAAAGMGLALLDMDEAGLTDVQRQLEVARGVSKSQCLTVHCNVANYEDCVSAATAVDQKFPGVRIAFLFNNAGILSPPGYEGHVLDGTPSDSGWRAVFDVNVFGVVNILKVFVPKMVVAGSFPSGMKSQVVTTSSVLGLYDGGFGVSPYNTSKMACTAICEQMHFELKGAGEKAAHIESHSLHPSMAGTNIFNDLAITEAIEKGMKGLSAGLSAGNVIDGLFKGIADKMFYIIVDDEKDMPTREQIQQRMQSQMAGTAPHMHRPMAGVATFLALQEQKMKSESKL